MTETFDRPTAPNHRDTTAADALIAAMALPPKRYNVLSYGFPDCPAQAAIFPTCHLFYDTQFTATLRADGVCEVTRYDDSDVGVLGEATPDRVGTFLDNWIDEQLRGWRAQG